MFERVLVLIRTIISLGKSWKLNQELVRSVENGQGLVAYLLVDTGDGGLSQIWEDQDLRCSESPGSSGLVDARMSINHVADLWRQVEEREWFLEIEQTESAYGRSHFSTKIL